MRGFVTSYENANVRFEQSLIWNNEQGYSTIELSKNAYEINVMGDSHVGGVENLDAFFEASQNDNVAAVAMIGDITTGHETDYNVLAEHLPNIDSLPYFAVVGNHDLYFDGWEHFYSIFGSSSYYFLVKTPNHTDIFFCLDTGGGTLGELQFDWFKNLLETERQQYRYCTVLTHDNLFRLRPTASTNPMPEENRVLSELFLKHNVNMVMAAHDHKRNTTVTGNTTHIMLYALQDDNKNASYVTLTFDEAGIDFGFIEL